jgi:hypothetical protein
MSKGHNRSRWINALVTTGLSMLGGAIGYIVWLAAAVPVFSSGYTTVENALWLLAPFVTALGFAAGAYASERRIRHRRSSFGRIYIWPLVGCSLGAWGVYYFGPMLIVFGMLILGTLSIGLREALRTIRRTN